MQISNWIVLQSNPAQKENRHFNEKYLYFTVVIVFKK